MRLKNIMLCERSQAPKTEEIFDYIYITFWEKHNYRDMLL